VNEELAVGALRATLFAAVRELFEIWLFYGFPIRFYLKTQISKIGTKNEKKLHRQAIFDG
jgi:hypothetical protein